MDFQQIKLLKHDRHPSKLLSNILKNVYIFSDISLPRLGKNMSTALQNMTESQKQKKQKKQNSISIPSIVKSVVLD